jgi:uncharacterized protein YbjT (DUF2867 family)
VRTVINTPSGKIGAIVAERLLDAGKAITIISRHPDKVTALFKRGARLVEGSIDDLSVLDTAMKDADSLFWVTPPDYQRPDYIHWVEGIATTAAAIAANNNIERAIVLSSAGAQAGPAAGPIGALLTVENAFKEALSRVTVLRAGYFMENFIADIPTIVNNNTIFGYLPSGEKLPMVATRDIADKTAHLLLYGQQEGFHILGVHGPEHLTPPLAAAIIGQGIGQSVNYEETSTQQVRKGMLATNIPLYLADMLTNMITAVKAGHTYTAEPRTPDTTTGTALLEFSRTILKPAIQKYKTRSAPFQTFNK